MNIGSMCTRQAVTIAPGDHLAEAAALMRDERVGYLVVVDSTTERRVPLGVITDRDLVVKVMAQGTDGFNLRLGDVMTPKPVVASEDDDVPATLERMRALGVRRMPIVGPDGGLQGVLSLDDVIDHLARQLSAVAGSIGRDRQSDSI